MLDAVLVRMRIALLLLGISACRADSGAPAALEFWAMGREGEVVQQLVPDFERRHPDIQVRVQQIPWSAAHEKLLTAYVGDAMPDAFQLGNTWIPELAVLEAIEPLDARLAASGIPTADYFPGILDTNVIAGATYGMPWYVDTRVLFYRTDRLREVGYAEPPRTWESWLDAMQRLKARAGSGAYAILVPMTEWQVPVILALQQGADLLRDHDQYGDFEDAAFRRAFGFYLELFRTGLAPRAGAAQVANLYDDFAKGYFAFYITGPWNIGEFGRRLPPELQEQWATAALPGADDAYPGVSLAGGASLAICRRCAHRDAAWEWIAYLSEPAQQAAFYRLTGDLPARQQAWDDAALRTHPRTRAFWEQLQHLRSTPKIPEWERIADAIGQHAEAAIRGDVTAAAALRALDEDVDAILQKRRWLLSRGHAAGAASGSP